MPELRHEHVYLRAIVGVYSWRAAIVSEICPFYRCFLYYWEQIVRPYPQRHTQIDIRYNEEKKICLHSQGKMGLNKFSLESTKCVHLNATDSFHFLKHKIKKNMLHFIGGLRNADH